MENPHTISSKIFDNAWFEFSQVNVGDIVDAMWGYSELALSIDDTVHLLRGGCLYRENGEYAQVVVFRRAPWEGDEDCDKLIAVCKQPAREPVDRERYYDMDARMWYTYHADKERWVPDEDDGYLPQSDWWDF